MIHIARHTLPPQIVKIISELCTTYGTGNAVPELAILAFYGFAAGVAEVGLALFGDFSAEFP